MLGLPQHRQYILLPEVMQGIPCGSLKMNLS